MNKMIVVFLTWIFSNYAMRADGLYKTIKRIRYLPDNPITYSLYGLVEENGTTIDEPKYMVLHTFTNGFFWAARPFTDFSDSTALLLSPHGEELTKPMFKIFLDDVMNTFWEFNTATMVSTAFESNSVLWGAYVYTDGFIQPTGFEWKGRFCNSTFGIIKVDGTNALWDIKQRKVIPTVPYLDFDPVHISSRFIPVRLGSQWGVVDSFGQYTPLDSANLLTTEFAPETATQENTFSSNSSVLEKGDFPKTDKDFKGSNPIPITEYEEIRPFECGYAAVCKDSKWGFIDETGSCVVSPAFEDVKNVHNGFFRGKKEQKWGIFSLSGKCTLNPEFDDIILSSENME